MTTRGLRIELARLLGLLSPPTSCPVEDPTPSTTKLNSRCEGGVPSPSPGGPLSPESVGSLQADPQKISPTHYSRPITAAASRVKRFFSEHLECEDTAISSKDCQQWCLLAASCSASKAAMDAAAACWFRTCSRMPSEALETKKKTLIGTSQKEVALANHGGCMRVLWSE